MVFKSLLLQIQSCSNRWLEDVKPRSPWVGPSKGVLAEVVRNTGMHQVSLLVDMRNAYDRTDRLLLLQDAEEFGNLALLLQWAYQSIVGRESWLLSP